MTPIQVHKLTCPSCKSTWYTTNHRRCPGCGLPYVSGKERMNTANNRWDDDNIQFPRLIAELETVGAFVDTDLLEAVAGAMDLEIDNVLELVTRAQAKWDAAKERL